MCTNILRVGGILIDNSDRVDTRYTGVKKTVDRTESWGSRVGGGCARKTCIERKLLKRRELGRSLEEKKHVVIYIFMYHSTVYLTLSILCKALLCICICIFICIWNPPLSFGYNKRTVRLVQCVGLSCTGIDTHVYSIHVTSVLLIFPIIVYP